MKPTNQLTRFNLCLRNIKYKLNVNSSFKKICIKLENISLQTTLSSKRSILANQSVAKQNNLKKLCF